MFGLSREGKCSWTKLFLVVCALNVCCSLSNAAEELTSEIPSFLEKYREPALERWSEAIAKLEDRDKAESHPVDSILFIGSSSIRLWNEISNDIAPYHPIRRGYGGARWTDVAFFADRLIKPHQFQAIVFFVGNDITGGNYDLQPKQVAQVFAYVHQRVRMLHKQVPIFYVAVTPTESRFKSWQAIRAGNQHVSQFCQSKENTYFIGTESVFLNKDGKPRPELFRSDKLHLSREGYTLWAAAIKSHLDTVLQTAASTSISN